MQVTVYQRLPTVGFRNLRFSLTGIPPFRSTFRVPRSAFRPLAPTCTYLHLLAEKACRKKIVRPIHDCCRDTSFQRKDAEPQRRRERFHGFALLPASLRLRAFALNLLSNTGLSDSFSFQIRVHPCLSVVASPFALRPRRAVFTRGWFSGESVDLWTLPS
jgi:hypothetical protein